jgi:hypothetical protein
MICRATASRLFPAALAAGLLGILLALHLVNRPIVNDKLTDAVHEMKALAVALDKYRAKFGEYPAADSGLDALISPGQLISPNATFVDPWGNKYLYEVRSPQQATLRSKGGNGLDDGGAADDIVIVLPSGSR